MTDEEPSKRGRGRPRKPVAIEADPLPKRPAHRPPMAFLDDPARFPVTLAMVLEAMAAKADGTPNLKATRIRDMAAVIFGDKSAIAIVPKAGWDASERSIARKRKIKEGAFLRMVLRPDLDEDDRLIAPDLDSASRQIRRKQEDYNSNPMARAWITSSAKALFMLTGISPVHRSAARQHLINEKWPPGIIDLFVDLFSPKRFIP